MKVDRETFVRHVRQLADFDKTLVTEGSSVCAAQYLDADGNLVASALYEGPGAVLGLPMREIAKMQGGKIGGAAKVAASYFISLAPRPPKPQTVGEAARARYPGVTFDTALPQGWVNKAIERGFDPRGHVVWGYPDGCLFGRAMAVTPEGDDGLSKLASWGLS